MVGDQPVDVVEPVLEDADADPGGQRHHVRDPSGSQEGGAPRSSRGRRAAASRPRARATRRRRTGSSRTPPSPRGIDHRERAAGVDNKRPHQPVDVEHEHVRRPDARDHGVGPEHPPPPHRQPAVGEEDERQRKNQKRLYPDEWREEPGDRAARQARKTAPETEHGIRGSVEAKQPQQAEHEQQSPDGISRLAVGDQAVDRRRRYAGEEDRHSQGEVAGQRRERNRRRERNESEPGQSKRRSGEPRRSPRTANRVWLIPAASTLATGRSQSPVVPGALRSSF